MGRMQIKQDGSILFSIPGDMKISVEMTEEMYEEFSQFIKYKDEYDKEPDKEIYELKGRLTGLSKAAIVSIEGATTKQKKAAQEMILELANDWLTAEKTIGHRKKLSGLQALYIIKYAARDKLRNLHLRYKLWRKPKSDCCHCCLWCKYFKSCRSDIERK